ncbi:MAG: hypothetical protein Cons2KO_28590 [Congregibacter sp.]
MEEGSLVGARIFTAGQIVDGDPPIWEGMAVLSDAKDAYALVLRQQRAGYDFIKPYSRLEPSVFAALLSAGRRLNMQIAGHVPQDVSITDAINGGLRTSEHLIGVLHAVANDRSLPNPSLSPYDERAKELTLKLGTGEVATEGFIDPARLQELAELARTKSHWFVPTTRVMRNFGSSPVPYIDGMDRFAGAMELGILPLVKNGTFGTVFFNLTPEQKAGEDRLQELRREAILGLYNAGAPILVGTDSFLAGAGTVAVDEMISLQELGIPTAAVLRAATLEPARYLNLEGSLGEVREGAIADLLLLNGNPLTDLRVLYTPLGVVKAGEWYDRSALDSMLDEVAASFARQASNSEASR